MRHIIRPTYKLMVLEILRKIGNHSFSTVSNCSDQSTVKPPHVGLHGQNVNFCQPLHLHTALPVRRFHPLLPSPSPVLFLFLYLYLSLALSLSLSHFQSVSTLQTDSAVVSPSHWTQYPAKYSTKKLQTTAYLRFKAGPFWTMPKASGPVATSSALS